MTVRGCGRSVVVERSWIAKRQAAFFGCYPGVIVPDPLAPDDRVINGAWGAGVEGGVVEYHGLLAASDCVCRQELIDRPKTPRRRARMAAAIRYALGFACCGPRIG